MRVENGVAYPEGDLTLDHTVGAMKEGEACIAGGAGAFDLSGLGPVDSATLSLLLNWRRAASAQGRALKFVNPPESLRALADLYGVTELVDLA